MDMSFFHLSLKKHLKNIEFTDKVEIAFLKDSVELEFNKFKMTFYLENHFEVTIYFYFGKNFSQNIDIVTVAEFLNLSEKEIDFLSKNQCNCDSLGGFIDGAIPIINRILKIISDKPDTLAKIYQYKKRQNEILVKYYNESKIKKELDDIWERKDYYSFLKLCENNTNIVDSIAKKDKSVLMKVKYSRKHIIDQLES